MTGSWLLVRWVVEGTAGLCVGVLLISWMIEGNKFVYEKPGQRFLLAAGVASYLSLGLTSRFWFVVAEVIYASTAFILSRDLAKKVKALLRADS